MESRTIHLASRVDFENGWFFIPAVDIESEGPREPFEIAPGVIVPAGQCRHSEIDRRLDSYQSRTLSPVSFRRFGGFPAGNQRVFGIAVAARRGVRLNASVRWDRSDTSAGDTVCCSAPPNVKGTGLGGSGDTPPRR